MLSRLRGFKHARVLALLSVLLLVAFGISLDSGTGKSPDSAATGETTLLQATPEAPTTTQPSLTGTESEQLAFDRESLELLPGDAAVVHLKFTNTADTEARNVHLAVEINGLVSESVLDESRIDRLGPGGSTIWRVRVSRPSADAAHGMIWARVTWDLPDATSPEKSTSKSELASLPVSTSSVGEFTSNVTLTVVSSSDTNAIDSERTGWLMVTVANNLVVPVEITRLECLVPGNMAKACRSDEWPVPQGQPRGNPDDAPSYRTCPAAPTDQTVVHVQGEAGIQGDVPTSKAIAAGAQRSFLFCIESANQIREGNYRVRFEIDYSWRAAGATHSSSQVVSLQLQFNVYGSEVLEYIKIPSIFFLPGILIALTFSGVRSKLNGGDLTVDVPAKAADTAFWIGAVLISIFVLASYVPVTSRLSRLKLIDEPRANLESGWGYQDIVLLWIACVIVGVVAAFAVWTIGRGRAAWTAWQLARQTIEVRDSPATILEKLARMNRPLTGEILAFNPGQPEHQGLVLREKTGPDGKKTAIICPPIQLHWNDLSEAHAPARHSVIDALSIPEPDAATVHALLNEMSPLARGEPPFELRWARVRGLDTPREVSYVAPDPSTLARLIQLAP